MRRQLGKDVCGGAIVFEKKNIGVTLHTPIRNNKLLILLVVFRKKYMNSDHGVCFLQGFSKMMTDEYPDLKLYVQVPRTDFRTMTCFAAAGYGFVTEEEAWDAGIHVGDDSLCFRYYKRQL